MAKPVDDRSRRTSALGDLTPKLMDKAARRQGFVRSSILSHWPSIVGQQFALDTLPIKLKFPPGNTMGGTLTIQMDGAAATLFQHVERDVIDRINGFFGYRAVERLVLRHGALPKQDSRVALQPKPLSSDSQARLQALVDRIDDPGLRQSVARLGQLALAPR